MREASEPRRKVVNFCETMDVKVFHVGVLVYRYVVYELGEILCRDELDLGWW